MRILERYTLRSVLGPLIWCLTIFVGLYLVIDLLGHLDEILRNHVHLNILGVYYGTMIPLVFVQTAPFACLMATLYALGNLNRHQELMAMRASGVPPFQIVRPILWTGLLMSVAVLLVNETVVPSAALKTDAIKENYLERRADPKKPHTVFRTIQHLAAYGMGHTLLYADTFDPVEKKMTGVVILQHKSSLALVRKITAQKAEWTGTRWRFLDGTILQYNGQGQAVGRPVPFDAKIIQAGDRPEILAKSEGQAAFMNTRDLNRYIQRFKVVGGSTIRKLQVGLYAKTAAGFACMVMVLIGIPYAIQPIRGGTALGLSLGLGVGLAFFGLNALGVAFGKGGLLPPLAAAWITQLGFAAWGLRETWRRLA